MVSMEHEIYAVMCNSGQKLPTSHTWTRPEELAGVLKQLAWAHGDVKGAVAFAKVVRRGRCFTPGQ